MRGSVKYQFKVLQGSEVYFDSGVTESPAMEYVLQSQGVFLVKGYVHCGGYGFARRSSSVRHYAEDTMALVDRMLSEPPFYTQAPVRISSDEPFQDIMIHVSRGGHNLRDAALGEGMSLQWEGRFDGATVSLYSERAEHCGDGEVVAISGIVGDNGSGCFVRVSADGGRVDVDRDTCAFGQLYVYESSDDTVVANHYYTLVRALASAGVPLTVDASKIELTLSVVKVMVMQQNNFSRMDVEGIVQVTPDASVSVVGGRVVRTRSPMGEILDGETALTYGEYLSMLERASLEVTEAVASAASGEGPPMLDLTGGLDSRALFAALTNTDVPRDGVNINTWGTLESEDVRIALEINSMYGYSYGESAIVRAEDEFSVNDNYWRNKLMGRIYSEQRTDTHVIDRVSRISGGVGGAFARPEYGRRLFWTRADYATRPREVADCVWQDQVSMHAITDSAAAEETFLELMSEEIGRTAGTSLIESYGLNYDFFRNTYHFDPETYYDHGEHWMYPLQTLTLFELNHRTHDAFCCHRLEIELINNLNPVLSPMRTSNKWGKEDYRNIGDQLVNPRLKCYDVNPDTEGAAGRWEARRRTMYVSASKPRKRRWASLEIAVLLNRIRVLSRLDGGRYRHVSESLLLTLAKERDNPVVVNSMYNRVSSAVDQIHLTEGLDRGMLLLDATSLYVPNPEVCVDELKALDEAVRRVSGRCHGPGPQPSANDFINAIRIRAVAGWRRWRWTVPMTTTVAGQRTRPGPGARRGAPAGARPRSFGTPSKSAARPFRKGTPGRPWSFSTFSGRSTTRRGTTRWWSW